MPGWSRFRRLEGGAVLYHGTAAPIDEFDERYDGLDPASFVTDSLEVARFFAERSKRDCPEGVARIISFRLPLPVDLPLIDSRASMEVFCEEHGIGLYGVEEMRDGILTSGLPGWFVAGNYPCGGADILLADAVALEFICSEGLSPDQHDLLVARRAELDGLSEDVAPGCGP